MEINEETYGLFDRYLAGNLSAEESAAFEKQISLNEHLRDEFQWMNLAVSEIRMNGKSILKKQLAEIGAAIPSSAFEKYSPSIKSKSFFKKWWWAIVVAAVAIGLAATWFILHQQQAMEGRGTDMVSESDVVAKKDFDKTLPSDSNKTSPFGSANASFENDDSSAAGSSAIFGDDCCSFSVPVFQNNEPLFASDIDSIKQIYVSAFSWQTLIGIVVECCPQKNRPAFYTYKNQLSISAAYADTSGLRFFQHGDALMMTDGKPGYFIFEKGEKEKPLVRIQPKARKGTRVYNVVGDTIKATTKEEHGKK